MGGIRLAEVCIQLHGPGGMVAGQAAVAEFMEGAGQALPGPGLFEAVASQAGERENGVLVDDGMGVVAQGPDGFCQAVACGGFLAPVTESAEYDPCAGGG